MHLKLVCVWLGRREIQNYPFIQLLKEIRMSNFMKYENRIWRKRGELFKLVKTLENKVLLSLEELRSL